eukprot:scaffold184_cov316-Pinguiococcus_pyrenoidosus.AAC.5
MWGDSRLAPDLPSVSSKKPRPLRPKSSTSSQLFKPHLDELGGQHPKARWPPLAPGCSLLTPEKRWHSDVRGALFPRWIGRVPRSLRRSTGAPGEHSELETNPEPVRRKTRKRRRDMKLSLPTVVRSGERGRSAADASLLDNDVYATWTDSSALAKFTNEGYGFDYVLVFAPAPGLEPSAETAPVDALRPKATQILVRMRRFGLQLKLFWSTSRERVFVKIRLPLQVVKMVADLVNISLETDPEKLRARAQAGLRDPEDPRRFLIEPILPNPRRDLCKFDPYSYIYGEYDREDERHELFKVESRATIGVAKHPFSGSLRLKIFQEMLSNRALLHINLVHEAKDTSEDSAGLVAHFPLHDAQQVQVLSQVWISWCRWPWKGAEHLELVRHYFGEQVALYFCFIQHYTVHLSAPAAVGLAVQTNVLSTMTTQAASVPVFIVFLCCWAIVMLEFWKRKEAETAMKWGTKGSEVSRARPEFYGEEIGSPVTGLPMIYYPPRTKRRRSLYSICSVACMILIVITVVAAIFAMRFYLISSGNSVQVTVAPVAASLLNALSILVLNYWYREVAEQLNEAENHRTHDEYENALILKLFAFQFVNNYSSFFYIAFAQLRFEGTCGLNSCMDALAINMACIFTVDITVGNILETVVPLLKAQRRVNKLLDDMEGSGLETISVCEFEAQQEPNDGGTLDDYLELAVQFGYVVLFAAALPAAPFMAWLNNYFEMRFDALRLLKVLQRPMPRPADTIGSWLLIFQTLAIASVITNAALICFVFDTIWDIHWTTEGRLWTFIIFQYFVFTCMYVIEIAVPDMSTDTEIQEMRQDYLGRRVIMREATDDDNFEEALLVGQKEAERYLARVGADHREEDEDSIDAQHIRDFLPVLPSRRHVSQSEDVS